MEQNYINVAVNLWTFTIIAGNIQVLIMKHRQNNSITLLKDLINFIYLSNNYLSVSLIRLCSNSDLNSDGKDESFNREVIVSTISALR